MVGFKQILSAGILVTGGFFLGKSVYLELRPTETIRATADSISKHTCTTRYKSSNIDARDCFVVNTAHGIFTDDSLRLRLKFNAFNTANPMKAGCTYDMAVTKGNLDAPKMMISAIKVPTPTCPAP